MFGHRILVLNLNRVLNVANYSQENRRVCLLLKEDYVLGLIQLRDLETLLLLKELLELLVLSGVVKQEGKRHAGCMSGSRRGHAVANVGNAALCHLGRLLNLDVRKVVTGTRKEMLLFHTIMKY